MKLGRLERHVGIVQQIRRGSRVRRANTSAHTYPQIRQVAFKRPRLSKGVGDFFSSRVSCIVTVNTFQNYGEFVGSKPANKIIGGDCPAQPG
jgi:hypothetical protein